MDNKQLGSAIAAARKAAALTASAVAELTGDLGVPIHRVALSKIEDGDRVPTVDELLVIAVALNTSPAALLFGYGLVDGEVEILPSLKAPAVAALQWFSGEAPLVPDVAGGRYRHANRRVATARRIATARNLRESIAAIMVAEDDEARRLSYAMPLTTAISDLAKLLAEAYDDGLTVDGLPVADDA